MSPTPTPSPSPVFKDDDGFVHSSLSDALAQQQQIHTEMVSSSTLTPAESAAFDRLMDGHPTSAAPIVAGIVLSVLVLVAAAVAFIRHRRNSVTSPATAEV
ncbi:MAG: hypothetical protein KDB26_15270 [Microthrixaceae bacterium]|nr:hypothetical protein [Microthrixaceae bacterium]